MRQSRWGLSSKVELNSKQSSSKIATTTKPISTDRRSLSLPGVVRSELQAIAWAGIKATPTIEATVTPNPETAGAHAPRDLSFLFALMAEVEMEHTIAGNPPCLEKLHRLEETARKVEGVEKVNELRMYRCLVRPKTHGASIGFEMEESTAHDRRIVWHFTA